MNQTNPLREESPGEVRTGQEEAPNQQKLPPTGDGIANNDLLWLAAKLCHEVHCVHRNNTLDFTYKAWEEAPEWQRQSRYKSALYQFENPDADTKDSHDAWCIAMVTDGWRYGQQMDEDAKAHPELVPYHELTSTQLYKHHLFCVVCKTMFGN